MFSSEPILKNANRFEPTFQRGVSKRADLSGRRVANFLTHGTPVNRSRPRIVESGDCGCLRHFDFCRFARRFLPRINHTNAPRRSPPRNHHVPAVVRHRRPAVFLEDGLEAIRDPSWSRDDREEGEGHREEAAMVVFGSPRDARGTR